MRDHSNIPKLDWQDDKATVARIKSQIMREEPVVLIMTDDFKFDLDLETCGCRQESDLLIDCEPGSALSMLAKLNAIPALDDIGSAAKVAGLVIDIDSNQKQIIIHD
ncbi:hypothetical protein MNBD_GAMMA21-2955 [hydrothermal vent metagenome]|uniref:Uncharacterized protein n=1 Tax=hydrothermal vent metagenome TaxID=652676 RepID=A0A3B1AE65_9ZZZZ